MSSTLDSDHSEIADCAESHPAVESVEKTHELPTETLAVGMTFMLTFAIIQRVVGLFRNVMFCHFMSDDQLGVWALANSFLMIAAPLAVLGLPGCFGRYVERFRREGRMGTFLFRISAVSCVTSGLALLIIFAGGEHFRWAVFRSSNVWLTTAIAFTLLGVILSNALIELMNGLRQIRIASWMRLTTSVVFAVTALVMITFGFDGAVSAIVGFGVGSSLAALIAIHFLAKHRKTMVDSDSPKIAPSVQAPGKHGGRFWSTLLPFAAWLWVMDMLVNLIEISDRYMLLHLVPASDGEAQGIVGQYHSSLVIPLILVGFATMVSGALLPHLSHDWEAGRRRMVSQRVNLAIKLMLTGFTLVGAGCLLVAPLLYDVILQGRYELGSGVLPYAFLLCIWLGTSYLAMDFLWCAEKGKWTNIGMISAVVINVGLNFVLVPKWGLAGAVIGTSITNVSLLVITLIVCRCLGCQIGRGMFLAVPVPMALLLGPLPALLVVGAVFLIPPIRCFAFNDSERRELSQVLAMAGEVVRRRRLRVSA